MRGVNIPRPPDCPECGKRQEWTDQYLTGGVGEGTVRLWACDCGHHFKTDGECTVIE